MVKKVTRGLDLQRKELHGIKLLKIEATELENILVDLADSFPFDHATCVKVFSKTKGPQ